MAQSKTEIVREVKRDCNSIKSDLIRQRQKLLNHGAVKAAAALEAVIIKLEVWQNR